jgi:hypothetical protein
VTWPEADADAAATVGAASAAGAAVGTAVGVLTTVAGSVTVFAGSAVAAVSAVCVDSPAVSAPPELRTMTPGAGSVVDSVDPADADDEADDEAA